MRVLSRPLVVAARLVLIEAFLVLALMGCSRQQPDGMMSRDLRRLVRSVTNSVDAAGLLSWGRALDYPKDYDRSEELATERLPKGLNLNYMKNPIPLYALMRQETNGDAHVEIRLIGGFVDDEGVLVVARGPEPVSDGTVTYFKLGEGVYAFTRCHTRRF